MSDIMRATVTVHPPILTNPYATLEIDTAADAFPRHDFDGPERLRDWAQDQARRWIEIQSRVAAAGTFSGYSGTKPCTAEVQHYQTLADYAERARSSKEARLDSEAKSYLNAIAEHVRAGCLLLFGAKRTQRILDLEEGQPLAFYLSLILGSVSDNRPYVSDFPQIQTPVADLLTAFNKRFPPSIAEIYSGADYF
jgi:hypothetical protein